MSDEQRESRVDEVVEDLEAPAASQKDVTGGYSTPCVPPTCPDTAMEVYCRPPTCKDTAYECGQATQEMIVHYA